MKMKPSLTSCAHDSTAGKIASVAQLALAHRGRKFVFSSEDCFLLFLRRDLVQLLLLNLMRTVHNSRAWIIIEISAVSVPVSVCLSST